MTETKWRARNFLLTLNEVDFFSELKDYMQHYTTFQFGIACLEKAPVTGHKHIHIFCQYNNPVTIIKKKLYGAHVDKCRGSPQQNINYIRKVDEPDKRGEIIWEEGTPSYSGRISIDDVEKMSKKERNKLPLCYYKTIEKINMKEDLHVKIEDLFKEVHVKYIFGKSGMGKTYLAHEWLKQAGADEFNVVSYSNGFWNGVTDICPYALYDDFRDNDVPPVVFINFIDYTIKNLNIKGGFVKNKYTYIFITSIQDPRNIYENLQEEKKQWLRRMEIYEFTGHMEYQKLDQINYEDSN